MELHSVQACGPMRLPFRNGNIPTPFEQNGLGKLVEEIVAIAGICPVTKWYLVFSHTDVILIEAYMRSIGMTGTSWKAYLERELSGRFYTCRATTTLEFPTHHPVPTRECEEGEFIAVSFRR